MNYHGGIIPKSGFEVQSTSKYGSKYGVSHFVLIKAVRLKLFNWLVKRIQVNFAFQIFSGNT